MSKFVDALIKGNRTLELKVSNLEKENGELKEKVKNLEHKNLELQYKLDSFKAEEKRSENSIMMAFGGMFSQLSDVVYQTIKSVEKKEETQGEQGNNIKQDAAQEEES
jgi:galactokinase/mevalonate kinase-like predicted kinase